MSPTTLDIDPIQSRNSKRSHRYRVRSGDENKNIISPLVIRHSGAHQVTRSGAIFEQLMVRQVTSCDPTCTGQELYLLVFKNSIASDLRHMADIRNMTDQGCLVQFHGKSAFYCLIHESTQISLFNDIYFPEDWRKICCFLHNPTVWSLLVLSLTCNTFTKYTCYVFNYL